MTEKRIRLIDPNNLNFSKLLENYPPETLTKLTDITNWLEEQFGKLPKFTVEPKPDFTGNQDDPWGLRTNEDGITTISRPDGAFFAVQNHTITLHVGGKEIKWTQPLFIQNGEFLPSSEGKTYVTGFVFKVYDTIGNSLVALGQEPGAPQRINAQGEEIHPALRTPLQASVSKLAKLIEGTLPIEDKFFQLAQALGLVTADNQLDPSKLGPATFSMDDANRVKALTLMGAVIVSPEQLQAAQQLLGETSHTITPLDETILALTGLYNGHLSTVSHLTEAMLLHTNRELWWTIQLAKAPQAILGLANS